MDIIYIILIAFAVLVFIGITISGTAHAVVKKTIKAHESEMAAISKTASDFCKDVLREKQVHVKVARVPNENQAAYDYQNKVIALSDNIYTSYSAVHIAVATHEVGHAVQDSVDTAKFRTYKRLNLGSRILSPIFWLAFIAGIVLLLAIPYDFIPAYVAFGVMAISVVIEIIFKLSTVSMEKQASKFALDILKDQGFNEDELSLAKSLYSAALTTYVSGIFDPVMKVFNALTWVIYHTIGRLFR